MRRRGRRRKQLLDDTEGEKRRFYKLTEDALDLTLEDATDQSKDRQQY